jgi:hypothetical protein
MDNENIVTTQLFKGIILFTMKYTGCLPSAEGGGKIVFNGSVKIRYYSLIANLQKNSSSYENSPEQTNHHQKRPRGGP